MKKIVIVIVAITLTAVFIFNSVGIGVIFFVFQQQIKKEMKAAIKQGYDKSLICDMKIKKNDNKFRRLDKKEFIYNKRMYDIISEKSDIHYYYFKCIDDYKEKELLEQFSLFVSTISQNENGYSAKFKQLVKLLNLDGILNENPDNTYFNYYKMDINHLIFSIIKLFDKIDPPPPKHLISKFEIFISVK